MQQKACVPLPERGAAVDSPSAAGKPAQPFDPSARATGMLPSGTCYGRDTIISRSSLGDSVSQSGGAAYSDTRGEADSSQDGRSSDRVALVSAERESLASKPANTAWRPPAGLPLQGSNSSTVSYNSSYSGAGSVGQSSNYVEASAAASFYKQRQQQHSSCIFGDVSDCASSVSGQAPYNSAVENEGGVKQRVVSVVSEDRRSKRAGQQKPQQLLQSDTRPAGMPTGAGRPQQEQQQRKTQKMPEISKQPQQERRRSEEPFLATESQQQQQRRMQCCSEKNPELQVRPPKQRQLWMQQQTKPASPRHEHDAALLQQYQQDDGANAYSSSRKQEFVTMSCLNESSPSSTSHLQQEQHENELSSVASMHEETPPHSAEKGDDPCELQENKCSDPPQPPNPHSTNVEVSHSLEGSTASPGDHSPSPASSSPMQDEHDVELERRSQQQHEAQHPLRSSSSAKEVKDTLLRASELFPFERPVAHIPTHCTLPPSPFLTDVNCFPRELQKAEENASPRMGRSGGISIFPKKLKTPYSSSFVPRDDPRSSREKQIHALRSTGSVMPVSEAADAAVAAAAATASLRHHGGGAGDGKGGADGGAKGFRSGGQEDLAQTDGALYPLNLMGRSIERDAAKQASARAGCARLLPLDIAWHSSAASVLSSRDSFAHGGSLPQSAASSPTSNKDSHGLLSPARERLLHQHCTSSVFAGDEDSSETAARPLRLNVVSSTPRAAASRVPPFLECEYGTKNEILQRRADQLQNPWYSDLFGRHTPKCSPTTGRAFAAANTRANEVEAEAAQTAAGDAEHRQTETPHGGSAGEEGNAQFGVDGATLDKLCAARRKAQLRHASNAYERFINAMQSDIWDTAGKDADAFRQQRLCRAHLAKETLLQEKCREQRRRQRLKEAVEEGQGRRFHMETSEEARVGGAGNEGNVAGWQPIRTCSNKRKTAELHIFGVRPDAMEEDIQKLFIAKVEEEAAREATNRGEGASAMLTTSHVEAAADSSSKGTGKEQPKYSLQVKLATDILTGKCKGTGKVVLRYQESQLDVEQVIRRLREAKVGVRQLP